MNKKEKLFPIYYKGKKYLKKDCDELFLAFYHSKLALGSSCGVYMGDKLWVYPDGSVDEY